MDVLESSHRYGLFSKIKVGIVASLATVILLASGCGGKDISTKRFRYPDYFVNTYTGFCVPSAIEEYGFSTSRAEKFCDCTLKEWENRYSFEEFSSLDYMESKPIKKEIYETCARTR